MYCLQQNSETLKKHKSVTKIHFTKSSNKNDLEGAILSKLVKASKEPL